MGRIAGRLLMAIAIIHAVYGTWRGRAALVAIVQDGFFNAVDGHRDRSLTFWFLFASPMMFMIGQLTSWIETQPGIIPAVLGWELLVVSLIGAVLMPISGFWLLLATSVLLLIKSKR